MPSVTHHRAIREAAVGGGLVERINLDAAAVLSRVTQPHHIRLIRPKRLQLRSLL